MSEIYIIFLTSYDQSMLDQYKIRINNQEQNEFYLIEKERTKFYSIVNQKIFVNVIKLSEDNIDLLMHA